MKRSILILTSILGLLIPVQLSDACGWDGEEYEPYTAVLDRGFFSPRDSKKFELFSDVLFNFDSNTKDDHEKNVEEWQSFLKSTNKEEVYHLVYSATEKELTELQKELTSKTYSSEIAKVLSGVEWQNVIDYLLFVRTCQPYVNAFDDWSGCFEKNDVFAGIFPQGEAIAAKISSDFLKIRIGYQLCRLAHYTESPDKCIAYYNQYISAQKSESIIYYWAMAHYAASLKAKGKMADAQFYYAQVYRHCTTKRYSSFKSMYYTNIDSALTKANDPQDKISLYVLNSLENISGNLSNMETIYQIDAKSPELEVLLYKEIYAYEMNSSYQYADAKLHTAPELLAFTEKVISNGQMYRPYVWHLSAGYLSFLNKSFDKAHEHYSKAKETSGSDITYLKQYITLLEVLLKAAETQRLNTTYEESLYRYLVAMDAFPKESRLYEASTRISKYVYQILYATYRSQGELAKSELLAPHFGDLYGASPLSIFDHPDSALVSKVIKLIDDPDLNNFEKYLIEKLPYKKDALMELQGTLLFRLGHLQEAIPYFDQSSELGEIQGDPFKTRSLDCNECGDSSNVSYTKKSLVLQMLNYEKLARTQPSEAADYYFMLGNAWYNTTAFGPNWQHLAYSRPYGSLGETTDQFENFWSQDGLDTVGLIAAYKKPPAEKERGFSREQAFYYDCTRALDYYTKALKLSTDKEFKAKCVFMAAKCEENARYVKEPIAGLPIGVHKYYNKLYTDYADTKFYSEIIKECSYIQYYKQFRDAN
ncbi:hypothetical protein BH09BAC3_BH09BAC3_37050 [soil metagenome]